MRIAEWLDPLRWHGNEFDVCLGGGVGRHVENRHTGMRFKTNYCCFGVSFNPRRRLSVAPVHIMLIHLLYSFTSNTIILSSVGLRCPRLN